MVLARIVGQQVMRELLHEAGMREAKVGHEIDEMEFNLFQAALWKVLRTEYPTRPEPLGELEELA